MFVSAKAAPRDLSGPNWILVSRMLIENINYALLVTSLGLAEEDKVEDVVEIKGNGASRGVATGKVKVIDNYKDFSKLKEGNVLVTTMTHPEFLVLMKKASAVITDEGGITCHAAIVSRELGMPCIIGTKIATKVLQDGDLVEVDGDKGIVRIIKTAR